MRRTSTRAMRRRTTPWMVAVHAASRPRWFWVIRRRATILISAGELRRRQLGRIHAVLEIAHGADGRGDEEADLVFHHVAFQDIRADFRDIVRPRHGKLHQSPMAGGIPTDRSYAMISGDRFHASNARPSRPVRRSVSRSVWRAGAVRSASGAAKHDVFRNPGRRKAQKNM